MGGEQPGQGEAGQVREEGAEEVSGHEDGCALPPGFLLLRLLHGHGGLLPESNLYFRYLRTPQAGAENGENYSAAPDT